MHDVMISPGLDDNIHVHEIRSFYQIMCIYILMSAYFFRTYS